MNQQYDQCLALVVLAGLRRLGFGPLANIVSVCLYKEGLFTPGSECSGNDEWNDMLKCVASIPPDTLTMIFERGNARSKSCEEDLIEPSIRVGHQGSLLSNHLQQPQPAIPNGLTAPPFAYRLESLIHRLQGLSVATRHSEPQVTQPEETHETRRRVDIRNNPSSSSLYQQLRQRRRGTLGSQRATPAGGGLCTLSTRESLFESSAFQYFAPKCYRRLCCYSHQYLETDQNNSLIPASVYHIRWGRVFEFHGSPGIEIWGV